MFGKPNGKSLKSSGVKTAGLVIGAKVSDGVAAILPDSVASYKSWGLAIVGLGLAACVNPSTTGGEFVQSALLGMAGKQAYNGVTEVLVPAVAKEDDSTAKGKFMNALIGHNEPSVPASTTQAETIVQAVHAAMPWEPAMLENAWDRPVEKAPFVMKAA